MNIFRALDTLDRRANFQTWLFSVSRNLCIDHYRSVRKERELVDRSVDAADVSPMSKGPDTPTTLEYGDRSLMLREELTHLPDTPRSTVVLADIQKLSYREITDRLSLPEGTVKSRINRGRHEVSRQIRRLVSDHAADNGPD